MQEICSSRLLILAVFPGQRDRQAIQTILARSKWKLRLVSTVEEAEAVLGEGDTDVVLLDSDSLAGSLLNLGGFDVVLKPFQFEELAAQCQYGWAASPCFERADDSSANRNSP
jgi:DNA-binding response OmpR family regulator